MTDRKINIFLQARSNSDRLPFKSLAQVNKIPLVVLCANRLMGKNFNVIVLTSKEKSDDYLVELLKENQIKFFRGHLNNVYKRFLDCAKNLKKDDIIIRTTADNPFVDYAFVKNALNIFLKNGETYRGIDYKKHNLPYGMSLEIFRKELLLKYRNKLTLSSKEHVTSHFYKYASQEIVEKNKLLENFSNLSCTLDTFNDYKKLSYVFNSFKQPTKVPWWKLIYSLKTYNHTEIQYLPKTKYILGGAQIGNKYANFNKLNIEKIFGKKLFSENFTNIDTAFNYSKSHEKISKINSKKNINIMTKLNYSNIDVHKHYYKENFFINFYKILISLNQDKLDTLLLHDFNDFKKNSLAIIKIFEKLHSLKLIENYGVSIYYPKELFFLMENFSELTVQLPINFVDYRWDEAKINWLNKKSKFILIGRSIFLRGKLLKQNGYIKDNVINNIFKKKLSYIKKKYTVKTNLELCIGYVNSLSYLNHIVIGFENYDQIKEAMKYKNKKFKQDHRKVINKQFEFLDSKYINILKI